MNRDYPIKPMDLDTSQEPKGFDSSISYAQIVILWGFFQFWQHKGNWDSFTHEEFLSFLDDPKSSANQSLRCGMIWFVEDSLITLIDYKRKGLDDKNPSYSPTHKLISLYFQWNPTKKHVQ